jgi:hypothetical protein
MEDEQNDEPASEHDEEDEDEEDDEEHDGTSGPRPVKKQTEEFESRIVRTEM